MSLWAVWWLTWYSLVHGRRFGFEFGFGLKWVWWGANTDWNVSLKHKGIYTMFTLCPSLSVYTRRGSKNWYVTMCHMIQMSHTPFSSISRITSILHIHFCFHSLLSGQHTTLEKPRFLNFTSRIAISGVTVCIGCDHKNTAKWREKHIYFRGRRWQRRNRGWFRNTMIQEDAGELYEVRYGQDIEASPHPTSYMLRYFTATS